MAEPNLGESDWDDDDLLSIEEAGQRIDQEIDEIRKLLATNGNGRVPDDEVGRLNARMEALRSARERHARWAARSISS